LHSTAWTTFSGALSGLANKKPILKCPRDLNCSRLILRWDDSMLPRHEDCADSWCTARMYDICDKFILRYKNCSNLHRYFGITMNWLFFSFWLLVKYFVKYFCYQFFYLVNKDFHLSQLRHPLNVSIFATDYNFHLNLKRFNEKHLKWFPPQNTKQLITIYISVKLREPQSLVIELHGKESKGSDWT